MDLHHPEIISHGLCAEHDQCCPVHWKEPAVLDMSTGIFNPSWKAQDEGWTLVKADSKFKKFLLRVFFNIQTSK